MKNERPRLVGFIQTVLRYIEQSAETSHRIPAVNSSALERAPIGGLRMVVGDLVEWSQDIDGSSLRELNWQLASAGLPTLSAMRNTTYREALRVLARGEVRTENEWHLLQRLVTSAGPGVLSPNERAHADRLIHSYPGTQVR